MGMYLVGLFVGLPCLIALIYLWLTSFRKALDAYEWTAMIL